MSHRIRVFIASVIAFASQVDVGALGHEVRLPGDPPAFFTVTAIGDEGLVIERRPPTSKLVDVPNIVFKPAFKTLQATTAGGKKLNTDELRKRLKVGSLLLVTPDEDPLEPAYLAVLKEETVILRDVFPRKGATGVQFRD